VHVGTFLLGHNVTGYGKIQFLHPHACHSESRARNSMGNCQSAGARGEEPMHFGPIRPPPFVRNQQPKGTRLAPRTHFSTTGHGSKKIRPKRPKRPQRVGRAATLLLYETHDGDRRGNETPGPPASLVLACWGGRDVAIRPDYRAHLRSVWAVGTKETWKSAGLSSMPARFWPTWVPKALPTTSRDVPPHPATSRLRAICFLFDSVNRGVTGMQGRSWDTKIGILPQENL
jgi:hypothetical protein